MAKLRVRDLMTENVYSVLPQEDLAKLANLMDELHVRHIPVVDADHEVVGLVSHRDLVKSVLNATQQLPRSMERDILRSIEVETIMVGDVITVEPDTEIGEAGQLMLDNKLGCLPVVEGGRIAGILTEADFVKYVVAQADE